MVGAVGVEVADAIPSGAISVGLVVLGSFLALGTSFAMEVWRTRRADRRKVLLLKRFLQHEIPLMIKMVNAVLSGLEERHPPLKSAVQSINSSRQGFERNREWVTLIEDEELRQDIFGYFSMINFLCHGLEEVAEQAASEEGLSVEGMQLFIMLSRASVETGEGLLKRLDEL